MITRVSSFSTLFYWVPWVKQESVLFLCGSMKMQIKATKSPCVAVQVKSLIGFLSNPTLLDFRDWNGIVLSSSQ